MKTSILIILSLLIGNTINMQKIYGQSDRILEQINFFSTYEITERLDELKLYQYNNKIKVDKAKALADDLEKLKQKCVVGFVYTSRLINKLNYYDKKEFLPDVVEIKSLYRSIHDNLKDIQSFAKKMSKNPNKYRKKTLAYLNRKIKTAKIIQKKLQEKSHILSKIYEWEKQYADSNFAN